MTLYFYALLLSFIYIILICVCINLCNSVLDVRDARKYIVFEDCLLSLLHVCNSCGSTSYNISKHTIGTFLRLKRHCLKCMETFVWDSQPFINNIPAINLLVSSSILFSGALPTQVIRLFTNMGCAFISTHTYFRHQKDYLYPAIFSVWKRNQEALLQQVRLEGRGLIISGDGRADSPGHSAKYGSYTVMELEMGVVLDVQLVQVRFNLQFITTILIMVVVF